ncbi:MAG: hypothetical protein AUK63_506 [bacterium P3]|nr:MAG: hypothetical protein AUK63_506 [bacterium P3]KWW41962.1 MAG: hypothetical protein F083_613 [bacterium F083]
MRQRSGFRLFAFVSLLAAGSVAAQEHGVLMTGGWCLPNDNTFSYISQPTAGLGYACEWMQREGWRLGVRADAMAMRRAVAGARFSLALTVEDRLAGPIDEFIEAGLSAYGDPYRRSLDSANHFIGSYLNCHIGVGLRYRHALDSLHTLSAALRFVHSSNGYLRKPNKGLNYVQVEAGFHFGPTGRRRPLAAVGDSTALRPAVFFVSYAPGLVQQRGGDLHAPYCYAHSLLLGVMRPFSPRRSLGAEVDLMYNYAHRVEARQAGDADPRPLYAGLCATYQRNWERLFMRVSVGTDVLRSPYLLGRVYERISLNCRLADGWRLTPYAGVACKAYYAHIDYIEWTLGVEF